MKKVICVLLALALLCVLCGCACKHPEWKDATCTEPKTCSACGATEGEALGHAWIDAACTEPKTCSVCGATEGEALGHAWIDATCTEPKTCSVCGLTEGEALGHVWGEESFFHAAVCEICGESQGAAPGYRYLLELLNLSEPEETAENDAGPVSADLPELLFGEGREYSVHLRTTADTAPALDQAELVLRVVPGEDGNSAQLTLSLPGCEDISAALVTKEDSVSIALPGFSDTVYEIDREYLRQFLGDVLPESAAMSAAEAAAEETLQLPDRADLLMYAEIILSRANVHNTVESEENYILEGLDQTVSCTKLTITPSHSDWTDMIRELAGAMRQDEKLTEYLRCYFAGLYEQNSRYYAAEYGTKEEFTDSVMEELDEKLAAYEKDPSEITSELVGYSLEIACDSQRVYAIRLGNDSRAIGYESREEADGSRYDGLFTYDSSASKPTAVLLNSLTQTDDRTTGRFTSGSGLTVSYILNRTEAGLDYDIRFISGETEINLVKTCGNEETLFTVSYDDGDGIYIAADITAADAEEAAVIDADETVYIGDDEAMSKALQNLLLRFSVWAGSLF